MTIPISKPLRLWERVCPRASNVDDSSLVNEAKSAGVLLYAAMAAAEEEESWSKLLPLLPTMSRIRPTNATTTKRE